MTAEFSGNAIHDKIVHILTIYPALSPSMLQVGVGPHIPPIVWKPILNAMIEKGTVLKEEVIVKTPIGQNRPYCKLTLA